MALFFKHVLGHDTVKGLVPLFHLSLEQNVPTFFSVLLLFLAALMSFGVSRVAKRDILRWKILCAIFLFLSFDEFAEIHERLIVPTREAFDASGFFYFAWIIPYSALVLILSALYIPWLFRLPLRIRLLLIASAVLYLTGVFVIEGLGAWYWENIYEGRDALFDLMTTLEESCEMFGVILFTYALSSHIERDLGGLRVSLAT